MSAPHTPGPWEVSPVTPHRVNVATNTFLHPAEPRVAMADEQDDESFHDDWNICRTDGDHFSRPATECWANARLIASAPELLAALDDLYEWVRNWSPPFTEDDEWPATEARVRAALKKAKGES